MSENEQASGSDASRDRLTLDIEVGPARFSASGQGELVLRAYDNFQKHLAEAAPALEIGNDEPEDAKEQLADSDGTAVKTTRKEDSDDEELLPIFLKNRPGLKNNAQIAAGIAVWASRYKDKDEFTTDDMEEYWARSKHKVPSNIPRDMGNATKEGWLRKVSTGTYATTTYGERYVDEVAREENE